MTKTASISSNLNRIDDIKHPHANQRISDGKAVQKGTAIGFPKWILRTEGLVVLGAACIFYARAEYSWTLFALIFLVPDLLMLGYLVNKQLGSITYNFSHNYILPAALLFYGQNISSETLTACSLIWIAHVGFDRLLGYGLKYKTAFKHTHLSSLV
ncbi:MAG: DUF4260 domain-containing protein [Parvibaculaceae bacterium]|nr:DUF4260 domain-containing protein [Parvibaculaceae bacterium]